MQGSETHTDVALARWRVRLGSQSTQRDEPQPRKPRRESVEQPRTIAEAASELGLSTHTVRAWISMRRIAHIRLGRAIRIPAAEIRRIIEENTVPAVEER
jgi:excisionase family DNA binding protein